MVWSVGANMFNNRLASCLVLNTPLAITDIPESQNKNDFDAKINMTSLFDLLSTDT